MKKHQRLKERQRRFVKHYLIEPNATKAAISAGYSEKTAKQIGSRLLTNVVVKAAIEDGAIKIAEKLDITAGYVLGKIKETVERCSQGEKFEASAVLKGSELLGKHLRLFGENALHANHVEFSIGDIPVEALREALVEDKARAAKPQSPALLVDAAKPVIDVEVLAVDGKKLVN